MGDDTTQKEGVTKHYLLAITILLCGTLLYINSNAWVMRFEMDDNTRAAVESVDFEQEGSANLWLPPTENWTMVTFADDKIYINGEDVAE